MIKSSGWGEHKRIQGTERLWYWNNHLYIEITQKFQLSGASLRKMGESVAQGWIITTREGIVGGIVFYVTKIKAGGEE